MEKVKSSPTIILSPNELQKGMYVSYLDRPWTETGFMFQGFFIETDEELDKLRQACEYVYVDTERSVGVDYGSYYETKHGQAANDDASPASEQPELVERPPTEKEFPTAKTIYTEFTRALIKFYEAARNGDSLDLSRLEQAANQVVDSVRRNPDALLYFVRTQTRRDYLYRHGTACAVMMCALGAATGMQDKKLKSLTIGGAVLDIGKTRVRNDLLNNSNALELSSGELHQLRRHVEHGLEIMSPVVANNGLIMQIISAHHERQNGEGYPGRLAGDDIPQVGQMAAIVDVFDAMVSERSYGRRATPYEAMRHIKSQRDEQFNADLVKTFQQTIGTYPTGSLVELSTGHVGFVIQQNPQARLQPRVYLLLNSKKQRYPEFRVADISEKPDLCIADCLRAGSYDIEY